ncbi:MAG: cation transporter [Cyanobacteria bacterium SID2]|nr:cation transporter [Cyanobacteria bacterium SID2]
MNDKSSIDSQALTLTARGNLAIAILGILFALLTRSNAILLDGALSIVNAAFAFLLLRLDRLSQRSDRERFAFGDEMFGPMLEVGKGSIELTLLGFAALSAIVTVVAGGQSVNSGMAIGYGALVAVAGTILAARQGKSAQRSGTPTLDRDAKHWFNHGMTGAALAVAFIFAFLMRETDLSETLRYLDPLLVLGMMAVSISHPLRTVRDNWTQLWGRTPERALETRARRFLDRALRLVPHRESRLRVGRLGQQVYVRVDLVISPDNDLTDDVRDHDRVRKLLFDRLHEGFPHLALDVNFTADRIWMQRAIGEDEG